MEILTFLSYNFADEEKAASIAYLLRKQSGIKPFLYAEEKRAGEWTAQVALKLRECSALVYLAGKEPGKTQLREARFHFDESIGAEKQTVLVCLPDGVIPDEFSKYGRFDPVRVKPDSAIQDPIENLARQISLRLTGQWIPSDGVPDGYLFDHEKAIIKAYKEKPLDSGLVEKGCPPDWPAIVRHKADRELRPSLEEIIGAFRDPRDGIAIDTRMSYTTPAADAGPAPSVEPAQTLRNSGATVPLTFPEAGPRQFHRYPLHDQVDLTVGLLVSGGIAPGINAVIDGIVKRHEMYHAKAQDRKLYQPQLHQKKYNLKILGYRDGLRSLVPEPGRKSPVRLTSRETERDFLSTSRQAELGGSLLATSRWDDFVDAKSSDRARDELLKKIVEHREVDILYVIGGDGSMRAAHSIWKKARDLGVPLSVIGIPKTMDNDILWVWQSFGFLSAVEKAREALLNLHTEAKSNPRLCILQLFGSDSGFVASHAGLASGICDAVLIPEVDYTMAGLFEHIQEPLTSRYDNNSPHGIVVMAETAIPLDARDYIATAEQPATDDNLLVQLSNDEVVQIQRFFDNGRRVRGQTPDHLRTGGLKIVSGVLQKMIKQSLQPTAYWNNFRVFTSEPRHLIRSVPPTSSEVIFAERLGALAVDNAMAGYTDFMVSQWLTEFVLVPLELVTLGRKRVPPRGIFWKSVLASTGQPEDMTTAKRQAR